jgi:hypothetical protein
MTKTRVSSRKQLRKRWARYHQVEVDDLFWREGKLFFAKNGMPADDGKKSIPLEDINFAKRGVSYISNYYERDPYEPNSFWV